MECTSRRRPGLLVIAPQRGSDDPGTVTDGHAALQIPVALPCRRHPDRDRHIRQVRNPGVAAVGMRKCAGGPRKLAVAGLIVSAIVFVLCVIYTIVVYAVMGPSIYQGL